MAIAGCPSVCEHGYDPSSCRKCNSPEEQNKLLITGLVFIILVVAVSVFFWFFPAVLGWVAGILMILIGGIGLRYSLIYSRISRWEVQQMKEHGKFEGEPDFMREFRVAESEGDVIQGTKWVAIFSGVLGAGLLLILFLLALSVRLNELTR